MTTAAKKSARKARRTRRAKRHHIATLICQRLVAGQQPTKAQLDSFRKTLVIDAIVEDEKK